MTVLLCLTFVLVCMLLTAYQAARRKTRLLLASEFFAVVAVGAFWYENDFPSALGAFCLLQIAIFVMNHLLRNGNTPNIEK